jgi:prenyltransferase beta subunit
VGSLAAAVAALALGRNLSAADRPPVDADVDRAVTAGLNFLARQQGSDGAFDVDSPGSIGTTSRALLAFLAAGNAPDTGRYGLPVRRAVDWLVAQQSSQGAYGSLERGIRPHLGTTTALAEAYGVETTPDRRVTLSGSLSKAVNVIVSRQVAEKLPGQPGGGWEGSDAGPKGGALPPTALSLLALRGCADIGLAVPQAVTSRAAAFTLKCSDPAGGFGPAPGQRADLRSTCAGVVALHACNASGQNPDKLNSAAKFVVAHVPAAGSEFTGGIVPLGALVLGPEVWTPVGKPLLSRLAKSQDKDGGWPAAAPAGRPPVSRTAATASALAVLTMSYPLLPIYQR